MPEGLQIQARVAHVRAVSQGEEPAAHTAAIEEIRKLQQFKDAEDQLWHQRD